MKYLVETGGGVSAAVNACNENILHLFAEQCMTQPMANLLKTVHVNTSTDNDVFCSSLCYIYTKLFVFLLMKRILSLVSNARWQGITCNVPQISVTFWFPGR